MPEQSTREQDSRDRLPLEEWLRESSRHSSVTSDDKFQPKQSQTHFAGFEGAGLGRGPFVVYSHSKTQTKHNREQRNTTPSAQLNSLSLLLLLVLSLLPLLTCRASGQPIPTHRDDLPTPPSTHEHTPLTKVQPDKTRKQHSRRTLG